MFIDTHTHIYLDDFSEDRDLMIRRALEKQVTQFLLPNIDHDSIQPLLKLCSSYPGNCFPMLGLHPCSVKAGYRDELTKIKKQIDRTPIVAIGEIGIDLYWDATFRKEQEEAFLTQIEWAVFQDLPFVIHSRESMDMILDILENCNISGIKGVFHCFGGTKDQAYRILELGFYMGIGGVLTFKKNEELRLTVGKLPLESLLLETDAPYLTPHPFRGKRNEPAYIPIIAEMLASCKQVSLDEIALATTKNAHQLFKTNQFSAMPENSG